MEAELDAMFAEFRGLCGELKTTLEGFKSAEAEIKALQEVRSPQEFQAQQEKIRALNAQYQAKTQEVEAILKRMQDIPLKQPPKPMLPTEGQTLAPDGRTPKYVVEKMLELAEITDGDILFDLGSGDGRILFEAVRRYRIQAGGVEANPIWYKFARERALYLKLKSHVDFLLVDALTVDLSRATVVTLYLSAEGNLKLRPRLQQQLRPGARIVSHAFDMGDWEPEKKVQVKDELNEWHWVYLWRIADKPRTGDDNIDKPVWEGLSSSGTFKAED